MKRLMLLVAAVALAVLAVGAVAQAAEQPQQQAEDLDYETYEELDRKQAQELARQLSLEDPSEVRDATAVRVPMTYAPGERPTSGGPVQSQNYTTGDCGFAYFFIFDRGGGVAAFDFGFALNRVADGYSYSFGWINFDNGNRGIISDSGPITPPSTSFQRTVPVVTGPGLVAASGRLFASTSGGFCYSGLLYDANIIT
jgi:hypothetical protein